MIDLLREHARPLTGWPGDWEPLLDAAARARFVLLGEATHGTREFYRLRAALTRRLITDLGFDAVAVEGDWPDCSRVSRYVRGLGADADGRTALSTFDRFPSWMWCNEEVLSFVEWLREHNAERPSVRRVGFFGLDLFSLHASIKGVIEHLGRMDPGAAARARARYACFDSLARTPEDYANATYRDFAVGCEHEVVQQLHELERRRAELRQAAVAELDVDDALFEAEQNARVVRNAEAYYRALFGSRQKTWNLRDRHMADTLDAIAAHLKGPHRTPRIVVWAHNSHVGDARATDLGRMGELNLGQLVRQRHRGEALLVGFTTYEGTVTAAADWGEPAQTIAVGPALPSSHEAKLHRIGPRTLLLLANELPASVRFEELGLERAIGVVYRPRTERQSHYFEAHLFQQFDAVIHVDRTQALPPLSGEGYVPPDELPETYPSAM